MNSKIYKMKPCKVVKDVVKVFLFTSNNWSLLQTDYKTFWLFTDYFDRSKSSVQYLKYEHVNQPESTKLQIFTETAQLVIVWWTMIKNWEIVYIMWFVLPIPSLCTAKLHINRSWRTSVYLKRSKKNKTPYNTVEAIVNLSVLE